MKGKILGFTSLMVIGTLVLYNCGGERTSPETEEISNQGAIRIMPLGNSITYGNYHPEPRPEGLITGYRQALWLMLKEAGYKVDFVGSRTTGADAEPAFDPHNEGYPGWTDDQIRDNVYKWLKKNPADIIILHIGTNGLDPNPIDVEGIFDEIDRYERDFSHPIKVIMAKIINRSTNSQLTTQFNQNIEKMALDRVINQGDDITVIDMEFETAIDYRLNTSGGEMFDNLHPFEGGHEKMAVRWFKALQQVLPEPEGTAVSSIPVTESTPGSPVLTTASDGRIQKGLLALYRFTEGEGNLVYDQSGVGIPLNLYINFEGNVRWDSNQGLEITRESLLVPSDMNMKVIDSCKATNAISMEAWIRTGNMEQDGPAHIISISDPVDMGISVSQEFEFTDAVRYYFTSSNDGPGSETDESPSLTSKGMYDLIVLQHLVYTRDAEGKESFYVDGELAGYGFADKDFSAWNEHTFKISLCNSLGFENPWKGKLFLAAIYNRALSPEQVAQNYAAGYGNERQKRVLPEQPAGLVSSSLSTIAAQLTWSDQQQDVTGFVIERKETSGVYGYVASVPEGITEYVDADLVANTTYNYRIKALNNSGQSLYSTETEVTTSSDEMLENLAYRKKASQSSTTYKGKASRAVDGNTDGAYGNKSVTHTAYELNAWWEVDLEDIYYIDYLEIWNRTDLCCKDRMARFYIFVSEEPFVSYDFQTTLDQPGVYVMYQEFFPDPNAKFNVAGKARYIRIQLSDSQNICLAELIAMGNSSNTPEPAK